jgi:hypothetical protein
MKLKVPFLLLASVVLALAAGCATVSSRIAKDRANYDSWPLDVREKVAAGQVEIGFSPEQVRVALGEPDRMATRTTAGGVSESWIYRDRGPRIGFGLGLGGAGGSTAYGVGVRTGDWPLRPDESKRVVFEGGKVSMIEMAARGN